MKSWLSTSYAYSVNPAFLLLKLFFYMFDGDCFELLWLENEICVVAEGTAEVTVWKIDDRCKFAIPIYEADV